MARSRSLFTPLALLAAASYALLPRLAAFVAPTVPSATPRPLLLQRVALAATAADVEAAKKKFELQSWAAKTLAGQGSPEAAAAQARAAQAEQAYLAVKAQAEGAPPPPPVAAAPAAAAPAPAPVAAPPATGTPVKEEVEDAKRKASLMAWAAKTLTEKGEPQAAEMQARADRKLHEYQSLKEAYERGTPAPAVSAAPPAAAPAAPAAVAAPAAAGVPTKQEVAAAKSKADLIAWAAKALIEKGAPQAGEMQAKADAKAQIYESLKAAYERGAPAPAAPAVAAPPVSAPTPAAAAQPAAATVSSSEVPTAQELLKFKKEADLMAWAAQALVEKGAPQAAEMQAKAQQKLQTYETLKKLSESR